MADRPAGDGHARKYLTLVTVPVATVPVAAASASAAVAAWRFRPALVPPPPPLATRPLPKQEQPAPVQPQDDPTQQPPRPRRRPAPGPVRSPFHDAQGSGASVERLSSSEDSEPECMGLPELLALAGSLGWRRSSRNPGCP